MGKSSNKRKSVRQAAGLVKVFSKGGITVRARRAFPPGLTPLIVHAFHHFINDGLEEGKQFVATLKSHGYDFFDFTMEATTSPQLGDADALTWAWASDSASSLRWLTDECLNRKVIKLYPKFFAILPFQLELPVEGSDRCELGNEIFKKFAWHFLSVVAPNDAEELFVNEPRSYAILKMVLAEKVAVAQRAELIENTRHASALPSQKTPTVRL